MALQRTLREGDVALYFWKIEEKPSDFLSLLGNDGPEMLEEASKKFSNEKKQLEYLAERAILFSLFGGKFTLEHDSAGAPIIYGENAPQISISHTKEWVLLALHSSCRIGVDIEFFSERVNKIVSHFMLPEEAVSLLEKEAQTYYNLVVWCAKEALFKAAGAEETYLKDNFFVPPFKLSRSGHFTAYFLRNEKRILYKVFYSCEKTFVYAACIPISCATTKN